MCLRCVWLLLTSVTLLGCRGKAPPAAAESGPRPVPVLTAKVKTRDVPIYLEGLGVVNAWKTVNVRPQVDGKLLAIKFSDGQDVRRGQLLARVEPRPYKAQLSQATGALARDTAQLDSHRQTLQRLKNLREQNHIAPQMLDEQQAMVRQFEGAVALDNGQLQAAKVNLSFTKITAPIDGVAGVRLVDEGNLVRASDPQGIVVLTQIDPSTVIFTLSQDDLPAVAERMREEQLTVEVYNRQGEAVLGKGTLLAMDNQINQATAMMRLKAVVPNPKRLLWPNQLVKARLLLRLRKQAVVVPAAAVQRGPKDSFVFVVQKGDTAAVRPVQVEALVSDQALLASGLKAGEEVVIDGQHQLKAGSKLTIRRQEDPADKKGGEQKGKP